MHWWVDWFQAEGIICEFFILYPETLLSGDPHIARHEDVYEDLKYFILVDVKFAVKLRRNWTMGSISVNWQKKKQIIKLSICNFTFRKLG